MFEKEVFTKHDYTLNYAIDEPYEWLLKQKREIK